MARHDRRQHSQSGACRPKRQPLSAASFLAMLAGLCAGSASFPDVALQPKHLPAGAVSLLAEGFQTKDSNGECAVFLPIVRGQLGDSLRQLLWGILYAENKECGRVLIAKQAWRKHYKGFLNLKEEPPLEDGSSDGHPVFPVFAR